MDTHYNCTIPHSNFAGPPYKGPLLLGSVHQCCAGDVYFEFFSYINNV